MLKRATLVFKCDKVLSRLWYSDGSGAQGLSAGIDGISESFTLKDAKVVDGELILFLEEKEPTA